MAKAEFGNHAPLALRLDPKNTVSDAELAAWAFKTTGITPLWYKTGIFENENTNGQQTPDQNLQSQSPQPHQSAHISG